MTPTAIIFIGIQATGKSTFFAKNFSDSHIRINMDMLNTRHREKILINACIEAKQSFVVDNTNPSKVDRQKYIETLKDRDFKIIGYYFQSKVSDSLMRNASRTGDKRIPDAGVLGTAGRLEFPSLEEGFDELYYVAIDDSGDFSINPWAE